MENTTKILNHQDKILFEKALKFYFFSRQVEVKRLEKQLQDRFHYSGNIAYSFILTLISKDSIRLEYLDFLNEEIKTLLGIHPSYLTDLQIKPNEIDEIEFPEEVSMSVFDEDENQKINLKYFSAQSKAEIWA